NVKTSKEKEIIGTIRGVVSSMIDDLSYPYLGQAAVVKTRYFELSSKEKTDIKNTMLVNMDVGLMIEIKNIFF
ncbi:MAG: hypothetical protein WCR27_08400, partial [Eubacteriales bacterium]